MASGQAVAGRGRPEETDRERSEHAAAAASFVRAPSRLQRCGSMQSARCVLTLFCQLAMEAPTATTSKTNHRESSYRSRSTGRLGDPPDLETKGWGSDLCALEICLVVMRLGPRVVQHYIEGETWSSFVRPSFPTYSDPTTYGTTRVRARRPP